MRAARTLGPGVYGYDDLVPGDRIETGSRQVTAEAIDAFAELSGDRFDIHLDAEAARRLGYGDRVAHGLLVLSMVDGLKMQAAATFRAVASLNWKCCCPGHRTWRSLSSSWGIPRLSWAFTNCD